MENTPISSPRGRWIRRLALGLTISGVVAGAAWGVADWQTAPASPETNDPTPAAVVQAEIQQLFAPETSEQATDSVAEQSSPAARTARVDRYDAVMPAAPELPPLTETTPDAEPATSESADRDRYNASAAPTPWPEAAVESTIAEQDSTPTQDEAVVEPTPPLADEPEVARGQQPDGANPLRQASAEPPAAIASPDAARNAFADAMSVEATATAPRSVTADPRLENARPLPGAAGRYRDAASSPSVAPSEPPAATVEPGYRNDFAEAPMPTLAESPTPPATRPAPPIRVQTPDEVAGFSAEASTPANLPGREVAAVTTPGTPTPYEVAVTPTPGLQGVVGAGRPGERVLEGPQSPAITIQKLAPPEIQVGKKCTFAVRITNNGQRAAQQVVIHDQIPRGTQLVGTSPRASVSGADVRWELGTLSIGEERIVEMEVLPTEEGELGSVAVVQFAAEASAKARCTKPELRLRLSTQPRVMVGEKHLVQIEISNPGSGDATNVMLLESLPEGVSHEAGAALEFEVGTLQAGETRTLDLVLTAEQAGMVDNVMTARADASLQTTASCQFEVIAPALAISLEGPRRKYLERPATFVVNLDNPGTASAKEVQLVAQLPKGLKYVNANNMGEYDEATHSVYWSLAELPANERGTVELTALPVAPGEHTIRAATRADQGLEDRTESSLQVEGMAALSFETRALENLIELGGETTCEIRVTNRGSKAATNVSISAVMPQGLRAISAKGDSQHRVEPTQVTFAPLVQLAPGAEALFHVTAQGVAPGDQLVKVRVTSDDQQPITKEASARVYADQ